MKYIVMSVKFKSSSGGEVSMELPVIFPDALVHADMAETSKRACLMAWPLATVKPISAGFLSSTVIDCPSRTSMCYGKSESLGNLESRGVEDDLLIRMADYGSTMK